MKKLVTIVGARPQFIKASPVSNALKASGLINEIIIHTGQHYDSNMSDIFFEELGIDEPKYKLNLGGGNHGEMTGKMLEGIEKILLSEKPDMVLVYGDTNSTLAGTLAAVKLHIPVAHVEAGLRSFNRKMPEEINRILADQCSDILFCPTQSSVDQLKKEGIVGKCLYVGDVMYDVALMSKKKLGDKTQTLEKLNLKNKQFALATCHRAENTDIADRLTSILTALAKISQSMPVVFPIHPRTLKVINDLNLQHLLKTIHTTEPLGFLETIELEIHAKVILTDSGGMQKEACFQGTPCITLRDETEWVETVSSGWNSIVGADQEKIITAFDKALNLDVKTLPNPDFYGQGDASEKICNSILDTLRST